MWQNTVSRRACQHKHTHTLGRTDYTSVYSFTFNVLLADQIQAYHLLLSPERLCVCVINPNTTAACLPALTPLSSPLFPASLLSAPLPSTSAMKFNAAPFSSPLSCAYSFLIFSLFPSLDGWQWQRLDKHAVSPSIHIHPSIRPSLPPLPLQVPEVLSA